MLHWKARRKDYSSPKHPEHAPDHPFVTPAKAGVQGTDESLVALDSRLRGNDEK